MTAACRKAWVAWLVLIAPAHAVETIQGKLGSESAWTGEPVQLVVTLTSPGPFSGTASFDLPEIPQTVILKSGNPVVGSETIEDQEWITQTHDFRIFTRQVGEVTVPPIQVRFEAREGYDGDPQPYEGQTTPLTFVSQPPPVGAAVLAATHIETTQTWRPDVEQVEAGDVVLRTITREAQGTTAMLMVPLSVEAPAGVRAFPSPPVVEDQDERGTLLARRVDRVRYQFEQPGVYELPTLEFTWWDVEDEKQVKAVCPGITVSVSGPVKPPPRRLVGFGWMLGGLGVGAMGWLLYHGWANLHGRTESPEAVAAKQVLRACRHQNAEAVFANTLLWRQLVQPRASEAQRRFEQEWRWLDQSLYAARPPQGSWSAARFARAFRAYRRQLQSAVERPAVSLLPLNPVPPW